MIPCNISNRISYKQRSQENQQATLEFHVSNSKTVSKAKMAKASSAAWRGHTAYSGGDKVFQESLWPRNIKWREGKAAPSNISGTVSLEPTGRCCKRWRETLVSKWGTGKSIWEFNRKTESVWGIKHQFSPSMFLEAVMPWCGDINTATADPKERLRASEEIWCTDKRKQSRRDQLPLCVPQQPWRVDG